MTTRSYTPTGNLEKIIDAKGNPTLYEYDKLNRLINTTFPDVSIESLQYDSMNNVSQKTTRKGDIISYTYDPLYRLEVKTYPDASTVNYSYDKGSRLISVADKNGAIQYEYDRLNRIINTTHPEDIQVGYEYDSLGNRTKLTYPDSTYINYSYDELNRLKGINDQADQELIAYNYDALSLRKNLTLLNGNQSTYQYDEINRLLSLANQTSSLSTISSFNYTYDKVGNRKSMTTLQGMHSYTYDAIYQLMGADYPEGHDFPDIGFTYDSLGNRIHIDKQGTAVNYATNSMNQYTSVGDAAYAYDENGNLISDGESAYEYDYENHLISASNLSHAGISYEYDPFGRRVEKNVDGEITKYIYDGDQVIFETDSAGVITAKYVYGAGIDEVVTMQRGGSIYFYHYDGLGNVSDITDAIGSVVESYSYDAYGNSLDSSSVGNPYLFNGRRFDTETGLYNYRARYYDPEIGRFLQTDPLGYYDNVNLYSCVNNNSLNWVDPFGLCGQGIKDWFKERWKKTADFISKKGTDKIIEILSKPIHKVKKIIDLFPTLMDKYEKKVEALDKKRRNRNEDSYNEFAQGKHVTYKGDELIFALNNDRKYLFQDAGEYIKEYLQAICESIVETFTPYGDIKGIYEIIKNE